MIDFGFSDKIKYEYTHGLCYSLCEELHQKLGLDIYALHTYRGFVHFFVGDNNGNYIDINGIMSEDEMINCLKKSWEKEYKFYQATISDVFKMFSIDLIYFKLVTSPVDIIQTSRDFMILEAGPKILVRPSPTIISHIIDVYRSIKKSQFYYNHSNSSNIYFN